MKLTATQAIELAKEIEAEDPIDWAGLPLSRDVIYNMLGASVIEQIEKTKSPTERESILLASVVKLTVENFVLELRAKID